MNKRFKIVCIVVCILVVLCIIGLVGILWLSKREDISFFGSGSSTQQEEEQGIDYTYIHNMYGLKTTQEDSQNNSDKEARFKDFVNASDEIEQGKVINVNGEEVKLQDGKIYLLENEYLEDVKFVMGRVQEDVFEIFAVLYDGTVSKIQVPVNSDKSLDVKELKVINNVNDLKYIVGYSQGEFSDLNANKVTLFEFIDIDGNFYVDK